MRGVHVGEIQFVSQPFITNDFWGHYHGGTIHDPSPISYSTYFTYSNTGNVLKGKRYLDPLFIPFSNSFIQASSDQGFYISHPQGPHIFECGDIL